MAIIQVVWAEGADRDLGLPTYATAGAAGADLRANFKDRGAVEIVQGARALVPTGLVMAIPPTRSPASSPAQARTDAM